MSNFTGFVYSMTIAAHDRQPKPLSEQEIILRERAADAPMVTKPGIGQVIRELRGSIGRVGAALRARRVEQTG